jgi:hypothetical protein
MHLLETYALSTGSKIKKPFIIKKFFPLPSEKYITIQNSSGMHGKCYDYFQDVVDFIYEKLKINGFEIIQIGNKDDKPLNRVVNLCGQTDINQTAFILDNSKLHIGNDSFAIHMASAFNIPLIGLYSVSSPEIAGPFWKNDKQICLTPKNWKPSFNPNESPKKVNEIQIEEILNAINLLLFNNNKKDLTSLYRSSNYHNLILESYPDQIIPQNLFTNYLLNIRIDYIDTLQDKDYNGLLNNLNIRPCSIITDKYINLQPLLNFKNKVPNIFYNITKNIDFNFIKELNFYGFNYLCIFDFDNNEEILNQRKLELIEYPQIIEVVQKPKLNIDYKNNLFYKSNKLLFSNGKAYISKLAENNNTPILNLNELWIKNIPSQEDLNYLENNDANFIFIFEK